MFERTLEQWNDLTGSTKVLKGYNILGLDYFEVLDLPVPDHHFNDVQDLMVDDEDE